VQDNVNRQVGVGEFDGAQHAFGVFNVKVARHREAQKSHAFLAMDQGDYPAVAPFLQLAEQVHPGGFYHSLMDERYNRRNEQEEP